MIEFPKEKRIRDLVTDLEDRVLYYSNDFKVYPQLVFPCASALRRLIFIRAADPTDMELTVHVFVPDGDAPLQDSDTPLCIKYQEMPLTFRENRSTFVLLEYNVSSPFKVPAGAILGLQHNRGALIYQKGHNDIQTICIPDGYGSEENFPLIAVDIGVCIPPFVFVPLVFYISYRL